MTRYAGDFQGRCDACEADVEFAIGIRPGTDPVAMHFGPEGPVPVLMQDVQLDLMVDDRIDVRFEFECPLCGQWSAGRATCNATPSLGDASSGSES